MQKCQDSSSNGGLYTANNHVDCYDRPEDSESNDSLNHQINSNHEILSYHVDDYDLCEHDLNSENSAINNIYDSICDKKYYEVSDKFVADHLFGNTPEKIGATRFEPQVHEISHGTAKRLLAGDSVIKLSSALFDDNDGPNQTTHVYDTDGEIFCVYDNNKNYDNDSKEGKLIDKYNKKISSDFEKKTDMNILQFSDEQVKNGSTIGKNTILPMLTSSLTTVVKGVGRCGQHADISFLIAQDTDFLNQCETELPKGTQIVYVACPTDDHTYVFICPPGTVVSKKGENKDKTSLLFSEKFDPNRIVVVDTWAIIKKSHTLSESNCLINKDTKKLSIKSYVTIGTDQSISCSKRFIELRKNIDNQGNARNADKLSQGKERLQNSIRGRGFPEFDISQHSLKDCVLLDRFLSHIQSVFLQIEAYESSKGLDSIEEKIGNAEDTINAVSKTPAPLWNALTSCNHPNDRYVIAGTTEEIRMQMFASKEKLQTICESGKNGEFGCTLEYLKGKFPNELKYVISNFYGNQINQRKAIQFIENIFPGFLSLYDLKVGEKSFKDISGFREYIDAKQAFYDASSISDEEWNSKDIFSDAGSEDSQDLIEQDAD